jgi:hypothetical protein
MRSVVVSSAQTTRAFGACVNHGEKGRRTLSWIFHNPNGLTLSLMPAWTGTLLHGCSRWDAINKLVSVPAKQAIKLVELASVVLW